MLVLVFQHGIGMHALWGTAPYGSIETLVPLLIFGFLFGVSMDYEVFILTHPRGPRTHRVDTHSIVEGVSRTGRLVTSAAIILFFALASLSTEKDVTVREIAAGMAAAGAGRDSRPDAAGACPGLAARRPQLVAAAVGGTADVHQAARARHAGNARPGDGFPRRIPARREIVGCAS